MEITDASVVLIPNAWVVFVPNAWVILVTDASVVFALYGWGILPVNVWVGRVDYSWVLKDATLHGQDAVRAYRRADAPAV